MDGKHYCKFFAAQKSDKICTFSIAMKNNENNENTFNGGGGAGFRVGIVETHSIRIHIMVLVFS